MKKKFILLVVGAAIIGTTIAFASTQTESDTKKQEEKIESALVNQLDKVKGVGEKWISRVDNNKEVYAQITLNKKMTVKEVVDFAKKNDLEIKGWSYMIDIGDHTAVGAYSLNPKESMIESEKRFIQIMKSTLSRQIEVLKEFEKNEGLSEKARNNALAKRRAIEMKLEELSNHDTRIIYGIKVKGRAGTIENLLKNNQIHSVKQSSKEDENTALFRSVPENWLKEAVK
ncbi:MAG: hypothetical protein C0P72_012245 [Clostridia bacterium]|jgi:hypothetical protein|nr:hypothetical protein [Bacillota bacterium]